MFKLALGLALIVAAFAAEASWLGFCFGTVVIGIAMIFIAPLLLIAPFNFLYSPGRGFVNSGLNQVFMSRAVGGHVRAIKSHIAPQIAITQKTGEPFPLDYRVVAYFYVIAGLKSGKEMSVWHASEIMQRFFVGHATYKEKIDNVAYHCAGPCKSSFEGELGAMVGLVQKEISSGKGRFLIDFQAAYIEKNQLTK